MNLKQLSERAQQLATSTGTDYAVFNLTSCPDGVKVEIIDHDNLEDETPENSAED